MFAGESLLSIIFHFLNFAVLCGLFVYLFKRYAQQAIRDELISQESALRELEHRKEQIGIQQQQLEKAVIEQDLLAQDFKNKIERWRIAHENEEKKRQKEQENNAVRQAKKLELQERVQEFEAAQRAVMPEALSVMETELETRYAGDKGDEFIRQIVVYMEQKKI